MRAWCSRELRWHALNVLFFMREAMHVRVIRSDSERKRATVSISGALCNILYPSHHKQYSRWSCSAVRAPAEIAS